MIGTFDEGPLRVGQFHIIDEYSKLGTFMLLRGSHYVSPYRLKYDDQIVLDRYHYSVNRFEYGVCDHLGSEPRMESFFTIQQDLDIEELRYTPYFPVSYFAIYDGRGGEDASKFLFYNLHYKIRNGINSISPDIRKLSTPSARTKQLETKNMEEKEDVKSSSEDLWSRTNDALAKCDAEIARKMLAMIKKVFFDIDKYFWVNFHQFEEQSRQGSSAVVAIIMGNIVFAVNLGDSSILLSRNFQACPMSTQHLPTRREETMRIEKCPDGFIAGDCVQGVMPVTRAIGHINMKKYSYSHDNDNRNAKNKRMFSTMSIQHVELNSSASLLLCEPDVEMTILESTDQFILLCCNGLFSLFKSPQVLVDLVKYTLIDMNGDAQRSASKVIDVARRQKSAPSNLSVIIILLHKWF